MFLASSPNFNNKVLPNYQMSQTKLFRSIKPGLFSFLLHCCASSQYIKDSIKVWFEATITYADVSHTLWQYQLIKKTTKIQHKN